MLAAHLIALFMSGSGAVSSPISQLSRGAGAPAHTLGLVLLAMSQPALATLLWRSGGASRLWRTGCILLALNSIVLLCIAVYFLRASDAQLLGPDANDPLAVLASNVGIVMGFLQPGLRRLSRTAARINGSLFLLWLALIPIIPLVSDDWLGAYERTVGAILLVWIAAMTLLTPTLEAPWSHATRSDR